MFRSLFNPGGNNVFGQNGGFNNPTPQSAGSGSTPNNQWNDPNKKKYGGWPGSGHGGGSQNNSQWPTSWPHHGSSQPQPQQPPATPAPTTPAPTTTPAPSVGSWQQNWEAYQQQQLAGLSGHRYDAEMAKDQRERDWYAQNKTAKWFPLVEKYLAQRYKNAPKPRDNGHGHGGGSSGGGSNGGGSTGGGGGGNPSAAVYTPGTFDRDPLAGT